MKKTTTRLFAILLAALLLCGALPLFANAEGIDITDKFTDPAFRAAVQELVGKDVILDTDVAGIWGLDVCGRDSANPDPRAVGAIKSLAGLEYFIALEYFVCDCNQISVLPDLPAGLKWLYCGINQLTSLPALPSGLVMLDCNDNQMIALPELPDGLLYLWCKNNRLSELPELPSSLVYLWCGDNQLSALPALPSGLEILYCEGNQLTSLPALPPGLRELWCHYNQLTSLDVTGLPLTYLVCNNNHLTELDVTGLQLENLDCRMNSIRDESVVKGFAGTWGATDANGTVVYQFYPQSSTHFWSAWPPFMQWILEYVFFGWLWMRWV